MILIINVCKERLHYYEFVKPIEDILGNDFFTRHYLELKEEDLGRCDRVIICGTSLADDGFLGDLERFGWLKNFDKPVLGICAGFQILGLVFGGKVKKKTEIGFFVEDFEKEFFGLSGEVEVYHLHNNYIEFGEKVDVFAGKDVVQAFGWKNFYGVLFHPEVRNKKMILEFCG